MPPRPAATLLGAPALDALASPVRLELLGALTTGPATVRDLAARLARSRQALYHHLGLLERAGLVRVAGVRGEGRGQERVYARRPPRLAVGARRSSRQDLAAAARAIRAILRLTAREATAALARPGVRTGGAGRELVALRGKATLTRRQLEQLHVLFDRIQTLLAGAATGRGRRHYAVTLVLTPARTTRGAD